LSRREAATGGNLRQNLDVEILTDLTSLFENIKVHKFLKEITHAASA
jgi:hypothetical protein